jgi:DNA-binding CsgD family transcriptional regulator
MVLDVSSGSTISPGGTISPSARRVGGVPAPFAPYIPPALEQINVPAYILDRDGRIRWMNPAARELAGDSVGRFFTSVLDPDEARRARPIFEHNLEGKPHADYTVHLVGDDGETTRVEISSVAIGARHRAVGMFGLAVPVRERRVVAPRLDHPLTPRQCEVLHLLSEGKGTHQIAAELHLSVETVRNHVRHILRRLGAQSRLSAIAIARRDGLI